MGGQSLPISVSFRYLHRSPVYTWDVIIEEVCCNASAKVTVHDPWPKANQHCTMVECREIHCKLTQLSPNSTVIFTLKGNLTIDGNIQNETGKYLWSLARLDFDRNKFAQIGERMYAEKQACANITTLVEMLETFDFTLYIAGGCAGGIILLIIIGLIFYKVGFFKRRYKATINEGNNQESSMPLNPQSPPPTATGE
ncbi:integrin alpha-M-like [Leucoraja erinacea]|uniref:integrin alpha-M-like n=1 Tax=Leucoraja erinaceus TaxID=7782 RepID=UPI002455401D|nr:integrin alpha-M-like [Leucoraja erinacea]